MGLTVAAEIGRTACAESIEAFERAVDACSEHDLLAGSRCHGWSRLDVVVHVIAGWQEMLGGLASSVRSEPSVDAASYWTAFAVQEATDDRIPVVMAQRRRTAAYARPASAVAQLHDVAEALLRGVRSCDDVQRLWQGHSFTTGDFLTVWAVEDVVHHLDLRTDEPAPASALKLARATIEALVGQPVPEAWTDLDTALIGTGRVPVPEDASAGLRDLLPALG